MLIFCESIKKNAADNISNTASTANSVDPDQIVTYGAVQSGVYSVCMQIEIYLLLKRKITGSILKKATISNSYLGPYCLLIDCLK